MMTPAIASYYAFLDNQILDDGGNFTDKTLTANPNWSFTISGAGPIPIESAVQSMTFYSSNVAVGSGLPSDCTASEPWSMSNATSGGYQATAELQYLLSGWQVGAALIPDGTGCLPNPVDYGTYASTFYLQPSDFTTWSMVKIRQPNPEKGRKRSTTSEPSARSRTRSSSSPRRASATTPRRRSLPAGIPTRATRPA
jgi:hypothetical protein